MPPITEEEVPAPLPNSTNISQTLLTLPLLQSAIARLEVVQARQNVVDRYVPLDPHVLDNLAQILHQERQQIAMPCFPVMPTLLAASVLSTLTTIPSSKPSPQDMFTANMFECATLALALPTSRPFFVGAIVNGLDVDVLVDSGSGESFISAAYVADLKLTPFTPSDPLSFLGIGNIPLQATQQVVVNFDIGSNSFAVTSWVRADLPIPLLWGRNGTRRADGQNILIDPDPDNPSLVLPDGTRVQGVSHNTSPNAAFLCHPTSLPPMSTSYVKLSTSLPVGSLAQIVGKDLSVHSRTYDACTTVQLDATTGQNVVLAVVEHKSLDPLDLSPNMPICDLLFATDNTPHTTQPPQSPSPPPPSVPDNPAPPSHCACGDREQCFPHAHLIATTTHAYTESGNIPQPAEELTDPDLPKDSASLRAHTSWETAAEAGTGFADDLLTPESLTPHLHSLIDNASATMTRPQRRRAKTLLTSHAAVFSTTDQKFGLYNGEKVSFTLDSSRSDPIFIPPRGGNPLKNKELMRQAEKMLEDGVIHPTTSPWNFPLALVRKPSKPGKPPKAPRLVVDLREFNLRVVGEWCPIPSIKDVLGELSASNVFSSLDATSSFQQIALADDDAKLPSSEMLAFTLADGRRFAYNRMPLGIKDSTFVFSRCLAQVLRAHRAYSVNYVDDVCVHTTTVDSHLHALDLTLSALSSAGIKLNPHKCEFLMKQIDVLGSTVSHGKISLDDSKLDAIRNLQPPTNRTQCAQVYGLLGFSRRYVPDFASIAKPISDLLRKDVHWSSSTWTTAHQTAFEELKSRLMRAPVLRGPDFSKPFEIFTDASGSAIGAVLIQRDADNHPHAIEYYSRMLSSTEQRYHVPEKEAYAIVLAIRKWRPYLVMGPPFKLLVRSDHRGLRSLFKISQEGQRSRMFEWSLELSEFEHQIAWHAGTSSAAKAPDALSRLPLHQSTAASLLSTTFMTHSLLSEATDIPRSVLTSLVAPLQATASITQPRQSLITLVFPVHTRSHTTQPLTPTSASDDLAPSLPPPPPPAHTLTSRSTQSKQPPQPQPQTPATDMYTIDHLVHPATSPRGTPGFRVRWYNTTTDQVYPAEEDTYEFTSKLKGGMTTASWDSLIHQYMTAAPPPPLPPISTVSSAKTCTTHWQPLPHPRAHNPSSPPDALAPPPFPLADADQPLGHHQRRLLHKVFSWEDILAAQQDDPFCQSALRLVEGEDLLHSDPFRNTLLRLRKDLVCDTASGLLLRKYTPSLGPRAGHPVSAMLLPDKLIRPVLHNLHSTPGHHGVENMLWQAQTRFFFPGMHARITAFVKQCHTCQRSWRDKRPAPFGHIESQGFMHTVGIDFAGPFKAVGKAGYEYIGIVVDHHSKFVWVVPTISCTAHDAILTLIEFIETVGTFPQRVVSDRGSFAISQVWHDVLANFGMSPSLTTSYNPQANGASEAQVKNIKRILKKIIQDFPRSWDRAARFCAFSYNQSYNSTIGTSPFFVCHGRHPRTTTDIQLHADTLEPPVPLNDLAALQAEVDDSVRSAIRKLGETYTSRNASLRRTRTFEVDDLVFLHRVYPDSFNKAGIDVAFYLPFHHTLYKIVQVRSPQVCRIQDSTNPLAKSFDVHIQRLKPSHPRTDALFYEDFYDPAFPLPLATPTRN